MSNQSRLYKKYTDEVKPALQEKRKYKNVHEIPAMMKIKIGMTMANSMSSAPRSDRQPFLI